MHRPIIFNLLIAVLINYGTVAFSLVLNYLQLILLA